MMQCKGPPTGRVNMYGYLGLTLSSFGKIDLEIANREKRATKIPILCAA